MFTDQNEMRLEIISRMKFVEINTFLNHPGVKDEIHKEN